MELIPSYTIQFTHKEASALKAFLGSTSHVGRIESIKNISNKYKEEELEEIAYTITKIYNSLNLVEYDED